MPTLTSLAIRPIGEMILASLFVANLSQRVVVISPQDSALDFSKSRSISDLPTTGKKSERKTYLINDGPYTKQEIADVLPYVASTKVEYVVRFNEDNTTTAWRPDGTLIKGVEMPWKKFARAFDYSPFGHTFIIWSQSKFSPYQIAKQTKPEFLHSFYEREDDSLVFGYQTVAHFFENGKNNIFVDYYGPKSPTLNIPFQLDVFQEGVGSLPLTVGASCTVDGSKFEIYKLRDMAGEGTNAVVDIQQRPELPNRRFMSMPDVDWRDQIAKYGMPVSGPHSYDPHFASDYTQYYIVGGQMLFDSKATAPLRQWKQVRIDKLIHFTGYFGQIAMRPNLPQFKPGRRAAQAIDIHLRAIWFQTPMKCHYLPGFDEEPETMPARKYKVTCGGSQYIILNRGSSTASPNFSHEVYKVIGNEREAELVDVWVPGNFDQERFTVDEKTHILRCEGRMLKGSHSSEWEVLGSYRDGKVLP